MTIPFCDLRMKDEISSLILGDLKRVLAAGEFIGGSFVDDFERAWAAYCGKEFCIGVSSGTDALRIALLSAGITRGHVVVPAMTFAATYEAIVQSGCTPLPVDVLDNGLINLELAEVAIAANPDTKAIIPVHLYGRVADMEKIRLLAERRDISVIEDACQSHGKSGGNSLAAAYSFYPSKNLGAIGDAGAIVTDNEGLADSARMLRQHGMSSKYIHDHVGYTARLDVVQAIALLHKLPLLDEMIAARGDAALRYSEALSGIGDIRTPDMVGPNAWHLYVIRTRDPRGLASHLAADGISTGHHYPVPPPRAAAFAITGDFPVADTLASECLSLPFWPEITEGQQEDVVRHIISWFEGHEI